MPTCLNHVCLVQKCKCNMFNIPLPFVLYIKSVAVFIYSYLLLNSKNKENDYSCIYFLQCFTKLTPFLASCLLSCPPVSFWKGVYFSKKEFAPDGRKFPDGSKFFSFRVEKGGKTIWTALLLLKIYSCPWKCLWKVRFSKTIKILLLH